MNNHEEEKKEINYLNKYFVNLCRIFYDIVTGYLGEKDHCYCNICQFSIMHFSMSYLLMSRLPVTVNGFSPGGQATKPKTT